MCKRYLPAPALVPTPQERAERELHDHWEARRKAAQEATTRIIRRADLMTPKIARMDADDLPDLASKDETIKALIEALQWQRDFLSHGHLHASSLHPNALLYAISRAESAIAKGMPQC